MWRSRILHFAPAATECLQEGEEEMLAFYMLLPLPPSYPGIQGGCMGPLEQGAGSLWQPLYVLPWKGGKVPGGKIVGRSNSENNRKKCLIFS